MLAFDNKEEGIVRMLRIRYLFNGVHGSDADGDTVCDSKGNETGDVVGNGCGDGNRL